MGRRLPHIDLWDGPERDYRWRLKASGPTDDTASRPFAIRQASCSLRGVPSAMGGFGKNWRVRQHIGYESVESHANPNLPARRPYDRTETHRVLWPPIAFVESFAVRPASPTPKVPASIPVRWRRWAKAESSKNLHGFVSNHPRPRTSALSRSTFRSGVVSGWTENEAASDYDENAPAIRRRDDCDAHHGPRFVEHLIT